MATYKLQMLTWQRSLITINYKYLFRALDFGPGQLLSFHVRFDYKAEFYTLTVLKVYPQICRIAALANNIRLVAK
jgi:hypothetical protein